MKSSIRVTPTGCVFLFFTVVLFIIALNTGNGQVYLLLFALLSILIVSSLLSWSGLNKLRAKVLLPSEVYKNRPSQFLIQLGEIPEALVRSLAITLELGGEVKECGFIDFSPDRSLALTFTFDRRGKIEKKRLTIKSRYPFGLFERSKVYEVKEEILVFPAIRRVETVPGGRGFPGYFDLEGKEGVGGDFLGIREFRQGDNPRRIYWRGIFRAGKLLVKQFSALETGRVTVQVSPSSGEDEIDTAASYASAYIDHGYSVRLVVGDKVRIPFGAGSFHRRKILRELALL